MFRVLRSTQQPATCDDCSLELGASKATLLHQLAFPLFVPRLRRSFLEVCHPEGQAQPSTTSFNHPLWFGVPPVAAFQSAYYFARRGILETWHPHLCAIALIPPNTSLRSLLEGAPPSSYSILQKLLRQCPQNTVENAPGLISRTEFVIAIINQNAPFRLVPTIALRQKPQIESSLRIFMIAGEPSGDSIGASLMVALRMIARTYVLEFQGIGG